MADQVMVTGSSPVACSRFCLYCWSCKSRKCWCRRRSPCCDPLEAASRRSDYRCTDLSAAIHAEEPIDAKYFRSEQETLVGKICWARLTCSPLRPFPRQQAHVDVLPGLWPGEGPGPFHYSSTRGLSRSSRRQAHVLHTVWFAEDRDEAGNISGQD